MAGLSSSCNLRREIQALAAENEELKQLVQLLLENHDLKSVLLSQYSESGSLSPLYESTRLDGQELFGGSAFLDGGQFAPADELMLSVLPPYESMPQMSTPPPMGVPPPLAFMGRLPLASSSLDSSSLSPHTPAQMFTPPPLSPGPMGIGHVPQAPRAQRMQQFQVQQLGTPPLVARLNLRAPSAFHFRGPASPDSGMQGAGFVTPDANQEFSFQSGTSASPRLGGRGYCTECALPFHPHVQQNSPLDDSVRSGSSSGGSSGQESPSGSAAPGNQPSTAAGSSYSPERPWSSPHSPGLPLRSIAERPPSPGSYPASLRDVPASPSSAQSSQCDFTSPCTQQQAYVPFSPNYMQSFSSSGFAYSPEAVSEAAGGKSSPASPGALTLEMLEEPRSREPYFIFPSSPKTTPPQPETPGTKVPRAPSESKEKVRGELGRQATSVTMKKPSKDHKHGTMERIVGEIAFQLDRRILSNIFPDRVRLYGFTVSNIPEKVRQNSRGTPCGLTEEQSASMMKQYSTVMAKLKPLGYDPNVHPVFTEQIVNSYGILRERPDMRSTEGDVYNDIEYLRKTVQSTVPSEDSANCMVLLNCLQKLSQDDGKPLFIW